MIKAYVLPRSQFDFNGRLACTVVCVAWASDLFTRKGEMWNLEEIVSFSSDRRRLSAPEFTMSVACQEWCRRWPGVMTNTFEIIEEKLFPNVAIHEECTAMIGTLATGNDEAYGSFRSVLMKWISNIQNEIEESMLLCTRCNTSVIVGRNNGRYWLFDPHQFTAFRVEQLSNISPGRNGVRFHCGGKIAFGGDAGGDKSDCVGGASIIGFIMSDHLVEYVLRYVASCNVSNEEWRTASEEERQEINWYNEIYCVQLIPNKQVVTQYIDDKRTLVAIRRNVSISLHHGLGARTQFSSLNIDPSVSILSFM